MKTPLPMEIRMAVEKAEGEDRLVDYACEEIERLYRFISDETILRERFVAHLDEARDAMEQVLDHAIDSRSNQGPIPVAFPEGETIGQREALAYIPLNELDGIRVALANIAVHGKIDAALGKVKAPLIAEPVIKEKAENVSLTEEPGPELGPHDKLPCKVSCEGGPSFGKGVTLGALLGYLARRVTYNELPGVTEEQKEGFRALLAEARGTCEERLCPTCDGEGEVLLLTGNAPCPDCTEAKVAQAITPGMIGEAICRLENIEGLLRGSEAPVTGLVYQNAVEALKFLRGTEPRMPSTEER